MRRAVITGLGAVTPVGNDVPTTWANLVAGVSGVDVISRFDADEFPVNIAAEVKGFDATAAMPVKEVRKTGLDVQYGVAAAVEAARDAEYEVTEPSRAGVIIGSAVGGLPQILEQQKVLETRGRERVLSALAAQHAGRLHHQPRRHPARHARCQLRDRLGVRKRLTRHRRRRARDP